MSPDGRERPVLEVLDDAAAVAARGAAVIAGALRDQLLAHDRATLALSGGRTPLEMLAMLATARLPWDRIAVLQVDERVAPDGHEDRNSVQLARVLEPVMVPGAADFYWMPVAEPDLRAAARGYTRTVEGLAGVPPVLDVVHLGLGADGHTASIFAGIEIDEVTSVVALVPPAHGRARMTLTLPVLNAARRIVWTVTGRDKRAALAGLLAGDPSIVGSRVRRSAALLLVDEDACGGTGH
jgi:6-phosphogluconolactonase